MSLSYNKLWKLLIDKNITRTELTRMAGISTNAMAKMGKNEDVRLTVLEKVCSALDCKIEDVVEIINDYQQLESKEMGKGTTFQ